MLVFCALQLGRRDHTENGPGLEREVDGALSSAKHEMLEKSAHGHRCSVTKIAEAVLVISDSRKTPERERAVLPEKQRAQEGLHPGDRPRAAQIHRQM